MEKYICETRKWTGSAGLHLSSKIYIEMSGELKSKPFFSQKMNRLKEELQFVGIHRTNCININMLAAPGTCSQLHVTSSRE